MKISIQILLFSVFCFFFSTAYGQERDNKIIQLSGMIIDADSLHPMPFVAIVVKEANRGTISDFYGYFSFPVYEGDTIIFSYIGYKNAYYVVPDSASSTYVSIVKVLLTDTIQLPEAPVYPWPTREQFKDAFLSLNIPDDDLARAQNNLELEKLKEKIIAMHMDGTGNYKYLMEQYMERSYYSGQLNQYQLGNPLAWAQFYDALKKGKLKISH